MMHDLKHNKQQLSLIWFLIQFDLSGVHKNLLFGNGKYLETSIASFSGLSKMHCQN